MQFILIILITIFSWLFTDFSELGVFSFYAYLFYLIIDFVVHKKISLLTVWNFSFFFIIISESIVSAYSSETQLLAYKYLLTANGLINIGYFSNQRSFKTKNLKKQIISNINSKNINLLFIVLISIYFFIRIERALYIFAVGRNVAYSEDYEGVFLGELIKAIGLVLPAILTYYFVIIKKKGLHIPLLYSSPIFFILFLGGTRFPLLFALLGVLIVYQSQFSKGFNARKYFVVVSLLIALFMSAEFMKHFRSTSTKDIQFSLFNSNEGGNTTFPEFVAGFMTNEGVVNATASMMTYFGHNDFLYGQSSSFLLYFWVPRSIWPDKPTMLGYWLIRETSANSYGDAHSASYAFTGDLYADFGWFSLIPIFFMGRLLKYGENFKNYTLRQKSYSIILGAMLYPFVFFVVRSPITSTINFIGILIVYYAIKKIIFK